MMTSAQTNFAFFGTDDISIVVLERLKLGGYLPSVVITKKDQPVGRKQTITPPLVKLWAQENNISILQPEKFKDIENWPEKIQNMQFAIVASFGKIIPKWVLDSFSKGVLNVHPSLLPRYRGPTPFQTSLLNGDTLAGVSIMLMDEEMDHGPILDSAECEIENEDTYATLGEKLAKKGGDMLVGIIPRWLAGEITPAPQDHSQATYTSKFTSDDGFIKSETILGDTDSTEVAYADRQVRALNPEPGTWTNINNFRIKILSAEISSGKLVPTRVVPAGKKEMSWEDFKRGNHL